MEFTKLLSLSLSKDVLLLPFILIHMYIHLNYIYISDSTDISLITTDTDAIPWELILLQYISVYLCK